MASRIAQIPNFLLSVVSRGFQPVLFTNYQTPEGAALNRKVFTIFILFLLPAFIFLLFFSGPLIHLFGGDKYVKAIPLLPYVSMTSIIIGIIGITGVGYFVKKKTYYVTFIIFFIVILNFIINYWMVSLFQIKGVAVGGMVAICIGSFLYIYFSEKLYSFNLKLRLAFFIYSLLISIAIAKLL
jgi:O-antigen/teichoic acid export membrane protein